MKKYPSATIACIIYKKHKILMEKRNNTPYKNYWCLPGGKIEFYEKFINAIKREVKEEVNLKIKPKLFGIFDEIIKAKSKHCVVGVFVSKPYGKVKINKREVKETKYLSYPEIKKLKIAYRHKDIIDEFFKNAKSK